MKRMRRGRVDGDGTPGASALVPVAGGQQHDEMVGSSALPVARPHRLAVEAQPLDITVAGKERGIAEDIEAGAGATERRCGQSARHPMCSSRPR